MADLTTLIAMLSGTEDAAICVMATPREMLRGWPSPSGGGGRAHPIVVKSALANPRDGGTDGGFAGGGIGAAIANHSGSRGGTAEKEADANGGGQQ